jgi:uncharacterized protein YecE (DUF72 family)
MEESSLKVASSGKALYIGTAGWSYEDWKGIVYPKSSGKGFRPLAFLARYFNAVELNNTFYRPPTPAYCHKWLEDVANRPDFHFTAKLWQRFTHERLQAWTDAEVKQFRDGIAPIVEAGRLGALLVQFPWSFHFDATSRDWLKRIAGEFGDMPLVLEVRSSEWARDDALDFIRTLGIGFCNIDQPHLRGNIGLTAHGFGRIGYMRLHGRSTEKWFADKADSYERYDYLYSSDELKGIATAIEKVSTQVERMYVIANNHYRGQAPANALQLMSMLTGVKVHAPETLSRLYQIP